MLNVFGGDFARNPWPVLSELRENNGGVHRVATLDGPEAWLVTRYDDVRSGLLDSRLVTNLQYAEGNDYRGFAVPPPMDVFARSSAEQLMRLRRSVTAELHPGRVSARAEQVDALVSPLLQQVGAVAEFDFVERIAVPLPAAVLEHLLGLSPATAERLRRWAKSAFRPDVGVRARDTLETMQSIIDGAADGRDSDGSVIARLVRTDLLNRDEIVGLLFYVLFVWYEILADTIAGSVAAFSEEPAQLAAFLDVPDRAKAVDELLRFLSPQVTASPRFAVEDLDINGRRIRAGQTVLLSLASANHDPAVFDEPDLLDVGRTANPHLGFGYGAHACVGTGLVRPVIVAVLARIYTCWPGLRVTDEPSRIVWRNGFRHRGPLALPVEVR
ncbi:cytochrome P450 [Nocardia sp. NPDC003963]